MKWAIAVLAFMACQHSQAGAYVEGGILYNTDAFGITSPWVGHIAAGYDWQLDEELSIDVQIQHESDPENTGLDDLIANESIGVLMRYRLD